MKKSKEFNFKFFHQGNRFVASQKRQTHIDEASKEHKEVTVFQDMHEMDFCSLALPLAAFSMTTPSNRSPNLDTLKTAQQQNDRFLLSPIPTSLEGQHYLPLLLETRAHCR